MRSGFGGQDGTGRRQIGATPERTLNFRSQNLLKSERFRSRQGQSRNGPSFTTGKPEPEPASEFTAEIPELLWQPGVYRAMSSKSRI